MPIQSYNPAVFIQRIETQGNNATREIVVNTTSTMQVADSINILGIDYLIAQIDANTNIITLDKDRDSNIDLVQTAVIEIRQNVPDTSINLTPPTPINDIDKKQKLVELGKEYHQRRINKANAILGNDLYPIEYFLDSESRMFLGTFNRDLVPILAILASVNSESLDITATKYKKKIVELNESYAILNAEFTNLSILVRDATSQQELDAISFS